MIPFAAYTAAETPIAFHCADQPPKLPFPIGDLDPICVISGRKGGGVYAATFWSGGTDPPLYKYTLSLVSHFSDQSYATA